MLPIHKTAALAIALSLAIGAARHAKADADIDARARQVDKSLVMVEYTIRTENGSQEETGQGIVVEKTGVILTSGNLFPESIPKEWIKDIKVRLPLKDFTSVPAAFLGRTQDRLFALIKTDKPIDSPVFEPGELQNTKMGENVFAIGMLGKSGGYATYVGISQVKTILDLTHKIAGTGSFGLTTGTSPVFDAQTGNLVGITLPALGESMVLREGGHASRIELLDEDQSSTFLPVDEIGSLFKDVPTTPFDHPRPWMAVDEITGIQEDVKTLKKIEQPSAIMVGSVIPNEPAEKAGLLAQDIILTVDGKQFSKSPVPELMTMHFSRLIEKHHPGDEVTLGILRDGKQMDIKVKLAEAPKSGGEMPHVYSDQVGVVTRDLVFTDAYTRHLPQDTKGVMVALVKNGAPANLGATPLRAGYLITKVNDQAVDNQDQFLDAIKKLKDDKAAKEAVFLVIQPTGETAVCRIDLTK